MPRPARAIIGDLLAAADPERGLALDASFGDAGDLGHGFYLRARRLAEAALLLHDHGFDSEAAPTRRSIFEHAMSIRWLAASPQNAYDAFRLKRQSQFEKTLPHLVDEWAMDPEDIAAIVGEEIPSNPENRLARITQLIAEHGDANFLPAYYIESELSHPSMTTGQAHVWTTRGDPDEVVAFYLHLATTAYDRLLIGRPLDAELEVLRVELNETVVTARIAYGHAVSEG